MKRPCCLSFTRSGQVLGTVLALSGNLAIAQPGDRTDTQGKATEEKAKEVADLASAEVIKLPTIEVIGSEQKLKEIPGSGFIIPQETLYKNHVFTTSEALRKVPGVNVRDEEGFGLRPNIGIRGQNPSPIHQVPTLGRRPSTLLRTLRR